MNALANIYPAWSPYAVIFLLALFSVFAAIDTSRRKRLLSLGQKSDPTELRTIISTLNAESKGRLFTVSRHSVVTFRGCRLVLVWGDIGGLSTNRGGVIWSVAKHLYALGLAPDREALTQYTDVLKEVVRGNSCSIYWIKNPKLLEKEILSFQQGVAPYVAQGAPSGER